METKWASSISSVRFSFTFARCLAYESFAAWNSCSSCSSGLKHLLWSSIVLSTSLVSICMFREKRLAFAVHHPQGALVLFFVLQLCFRGHFDLLSTPSQQRHCGGLNGIVGHRCTEPDVVPRFSVLAAESTLVTSQKDASGPRASLCTPCKRRAHTTRSVRRLSIALAAWRMSSRLREESLGAEDSATLSRTATGRFMVTIVTNADRDSTQQPETATSEKEH